MSGFVVTENGRMVDAEVERIASIIKDYDPNLELAWIPPENRELNEEFPFCVLYRNPNTGRTEEALKLRETEIDHRVLARLFSNDNTKQNVLEAIENEEQARQLVELKRKMDEEEERKELAAWMIKARPGAISPGGNRLE